MRSDEKIRSLIKGPCDSIGSLGAADLDRYMVIATDDELSEARVYALDNGQSTLGVVVKAEQQRRVEAERHTNVIDRLVVLEKAHWTTTPGFYATIAGVLLAGLAAWFAWLSIPRPNYQDDVTPQNDILIQKPVILPLPTNPTK